MKRFFAASAAVILLAACSQAEPETQEVVVVDDAPVAGAAKIVAPADDLSLTISDGYIMAPLKGRDVAAGYFLVENEGAAAARLVSVTSPIAETIELHTHSMADGVMKMREVDGIDFPAGEAVSLEPGGLHLMMFGFNRGEEQTEAVVTLRLETGEGLSITLPIRERE